MWSNTYWKTMQKPKEPGYFLERNSAYSDWASSKEVSHNAWFSHFDNSWRSIGVLTECVENLDSTLIKIYLSIEILFPNQITSILELQSFCRHNCCDADVYRGMLCSLTLTWFSILGELIINFWRCRRMMVNIVQ